MRPGLRFAVQILLSAHLAQQDYRNIVERMESPP